MKFHRRVIHGALGEAERCVMASLRKPRGEKSYYKKMKTNISPFCCCDVIKDIGSSQEEEDNLVGRQASVEKRPIHLTANGSLFFSLIFLPNGLCIHARAHFICFVVVVFLFFFPPFLFAFCECTPVPNCCCTCVIKKVSCA